MTGDLIFCSAPMRVLREICSTRDAVRGGSVGRLSQRQRARSSLIGSGQRAVLWHGIVHAGLNHRWLQPHAEAEAAEAARQIDHRPSVVLLLRRPTALPWDCWLPPAAAEK